MTETLAKLESEVEEARAKLVKDLSVLRSPQTYREFTADLRSEAQSVAHRVIDDVKARAAANPSAVLAISAGIAWKLLKDPPIATALIGVGMFGLWRTKPSDVHGGDYFGTAQQRLREQVGEAMDTVKDHVSETSIAVQKNVRNYAQSAGKIVEGIVSSAEDTIEGLGNVRAAAAAIPEDAIDAAQRTTSQMGRALNGGSFRDQLLLGAAGVAVAAALGLAYQRRMSGEFQEGA